MISDFWPFHDGQGVTAGQWNELFSSVRDGSFFLAGVTGSEAIATIASRLTSVEAGLTALEASQWVISAKREQFILTENQSSISLAEVPVLDSEHLFVEGSCWSKTGVPSGFTGDYSLSGSTITISADKAALVSAGDIAIVTYNYEDD